MKTVYLVRHAKSSWDFLHLRDDERPLLQKGIKRTELIARYLKENDHIPEKLISSHAVRAHETAKVIAEAISYPAERIEIDERIYYEGMSAFFNILYEGENSLNSVMFFGHNPAITQMANHYLIPKVDYMPTSAVVAIDIQTDTWETIDLASAKIRFYIYPKMLKRTNH